MKKLCFHTKLNEPQTSLIRILETAIRMKVGLEHKLDNDLIEFFLNYKPNANYQREFKHLEGFYTEVFDYNLIKNKITILDNYPLEEYDNKWGGIMKTEDGIQVKYRIELGIPLNGKVINFHNFHNLEDMIIQLLNIMDTSLFFLHIGYMNSAEGVYMSLAENNFGDIFFYEEDPEYARPEQIHFITSSFMNYWE